MPCVNLSKAQSPAHIREFLHDNLKCADSVIDLNGRLWVPAAYKRFQRTLGLVHPVVIDWNAAQFRKNSNHAKKVSCIPSQEFKRPKQGCSVRAIH